MSLSNSRTVFGVHSFSAYQRGSFLPYGTALIVKDSSLSFSGELVGLTGGSSRYEFQNEVSTITAELSLSLAEFPTWTYSLFMGKEPTVNAAEALGSVTALTNREGATTQDASTGIATVGVLAGSETDLKAGRYVVRVESATTVSVYGLSNVDFARGVDLDFQDDSLKVTAANLTITTSTPVTVPNLGVELTGGSGAIALGAVGNTASFEIRPINSGSMEVTIGATTDSFPEFGAWLVASKQASGRMFFIDVFRLVGAGMPHGLAEKTFAEPAVTAKAFFDSARGGVAHIEDIEPLTAT